MKLYRMSAGAFVEHGEQLFPIKAQSWDELIAAPGLLDRARQAPSGVAASVEPAKVLAPVVGQQVWAAGVTYYRSRSTRIGSGKSDFGSIALRRRKVSEVLLACLSGAIGRCR